MSEDNNIYVSLYSQTIIVPDSHHPLVKWYFNTNWLANVGISISLSDWITSSQHKSLSLSNQVLQYNIYYVWIYG